MKPLFSIVTVAYSASKTINSTLDSVKSQTFSNYQFVLIDGGSTDGTIEIIKKHELIPDYFVSEADGGISDAFNKGILASKGEYIIFLSADDVFYNEFVLSNLNRYLSSLNEMPDVISASVIKVLGNKKTLVNGPNDISALTKDMVINHPSMFVKRGALIEIGMFDCQYKLAMDYEISLKLFQKNYSFCTLNDVITVVSEEGVSHKNYIKSRIEVLKIQRKQGIGLKAYLNFLNSFIRSNFRTLLECVGLNFFVDYYRERVSTNKKKRLL